MTPTSPAPSATPSPRSTAAVRPAPELDLVIAGDGPAGLALGAAAADRGLRVVVVGDGGAWTPTYGAWIDEVPPIAIDAVGVHTVIDVHAGERIGLTRRYGVFDNDRLRRVLDRAERRTAQVTSIRHFTWGSQVETSTDELLTAALVVDATGSRSGFVQWPHRRRPPSFQTAYGVVLADRPEVIGGDAAVLMDWRPPEPSVIDDPTFLYVVPLPGGGWLVEETSLARTTPLDAVELRRRLTARLGFDPTPRAERVEHVRIAMTPGVPLRSQAIVGFGAAAGYVHPATGYSVTASLRAAPRVASAIVDSLGGSAEPRRLALDAWNAVWPSEQRRARSLHDYGLATLLRLPADDVAAFFGAFFDLPTSVWAEYLRIDTTPAAVGRAMAGVFNSVSWPLRRRLATGNPAAFGRLVR